MADCHQANHTRLAVDRIDDPEAADAVLPEPVELAEQRLATLGVGCNGANG